MHSWHCNLVAAAEICIASLVTDNQAHFCLKEKNAEMMQYYLLKTNDGQTMVYQWLSVHPETRKKEVMCPSSLVVQTNCLRRVSYLHHLFFKHLAWHILRKFPKH